MTIRGTLKEVPYTVYTRYSWRWKQFQWKFLPKPSSKKNERTENNIQGSKEAGNDEMEITKRPTLYVPPWKKSIKSVDKTNPASSVFKFSSNYISVALTHIMAAIIVLLS